MKLQNLFNSIKEDCETILNFYKLKINDSRIDHGESGLKFMHNLLDIISKNRAYADDHPMFAQKVCPRILPYDGRNYCFFYEGGGKDSHLEVLLKKIKKELEKK